MQADRQPEREAQAEDLDLDEVFEIRERRIHFTKTWRTGRSIGRTIYVQNGDTPDKGDQVVGMMDSRELAAQVVSSVNRYEEMYQTNRRLRHEISGLRSLLEKTRARLQEEEELTSLLDKKLRDADRLKSERDEWKHKAMDAGVQGRRAADREWCDRLEAERASFQSKLETMAATIEEQKKSIERYKRVVRVQGAQISELIARIAEEAL